MAEIDTAKFREYTLSTDEFNRPKVLTESAAIATKLVEIAMLEPGTYPTRPYMGLGLRSRFRYTFDVDLEDLKTAYKEQIETYLPDFNSVDVKITMADAIIRFYISIDEVVYTLVLDKKTKTLESL